MKISHHFDAGSIEIVALNDFDDIQLNLRADNAADTRQWFYFRLQGAAYQPCTLRILNAGEALYPKAWEDYQAMASYDRINWFRVPTDFDGSTLIITHTPLTGSVYYAYFEPYSQEQHLTLIGQAQSSGLCQVSDLGSSVQGRDLNLLTIGHEVASDFKIWLIARQHPGETMAEWFIEGVLEKLLDPQSVISRALLDRATFYIVPNMNPDGSALGNLRTNATGMNLNREWQNPNPDTSPEVFHVREKMLEIGVDLCLDIHGDETLPYVFLVGTEGIPAQSARVAALEVDFLAHFMQAAPDVQNKYGYAKKTPSADNLTWATTWVGHTFDCLSFTLEMPFKDNHNWPDDDFGWDGKRSAHLGAAVLHPIYAVLERLR